MVCRLTAGGKWIRTFGTATQKPAISETFRASRAAATWADVVRPFTDFDELQKCADIRMRYLATPTSTNVGVTRLAGPNFMMEIEAVAVVNSSEAGPGRRRYGGSASPIRGSGNPRSLVEVQAARLLASTTPVAGSRKAQASPTH